MREQFATFDIAVKLKKLGFNEPCFGYYRPMKDWMMSGNKFNPERHFHGCNWDNPDHSMYFLYVQNSFGDRTSAVKNSEFTKATENIAIPIWDQVIDWLDLKGKIISVKPTTRSGSVRYIYSISVALVKPNEGAIITQMSVDSYATRAEAREQAIIKALTLIK